MGTYSGKQLVSKDQRCINTGQVPIFHLDGFKIITLFVFAEVTEVMSETGQIIQSHTGSNMILYDVNKYQSITNIYL